MGPEVVLKVQHGDMRGLMDSDVRNLGRLAAFVREAMPLDVIPVRAGPLTCLMHGHSGSSKHCLKSHAEAARPPANLFH